LFLFSFLWGSGLGFPTVGDSGFFPVGAIGILTLFYAFNTTPLLFPNIPCDETGHTQ
jgi:hypothetical protein